MLQKRRLIPPLLVFLIGLAATTVAAFVVLRIDEARQRARFDALTDAVVSTIEGRLNEQCVLLRGVAGLFHASKDVGPEEFRDYLARIRLAENHPGVLGVGFSLLARDKDELDRAVEGARAAGDRQFAAWPARDSYPVSTILYLEPKSPANLQALGFDMYGEPVRREAMARALRTGRTALSGKVRLVQDQGLGDTAGFLLYAPVGPESGARPGTAAGRASGWAYSPIRARELFAAALSRRDLADAAVEVYDGAPRPENLLFRSSAEPGRQSLRNERVLTFAGRAWTVQVTALPAFLQKSSLPLGTTVIGGGILISLLLTALALQQANAAARTEEEVQRATEELRRANDELVAAAKAREQAEEQVRQMQKMEAIGQLTGGIAHDFNNMLAIVLGNLDLAERRASEPERLKRSLALAREGAARAADLTQRLLAFGRRQPLQPRVIDANRLVSGMSELLHRALGETVRLETVLASGLWPVEVDPGQLENSLVNLAINARDAMPQGGALTIETANCHFDDGYAARHGGVAPGQYVMIAVTDTGTGMSPDVAERALEPFFTTKEVGRGTGLGLSQVFGFVKQSGGHLNIYSELGRGTTVKIYLPRAYASVDPIETEPREAALPRGESDELIIVAEDEDGVRSVAVETLREQGYTVVEARNGAEALEALERHGGAALLFTDVVMPGVDGRELAERARQACPGLRVLFTTGYTRNAIIHDGRLDADVQLITKPFSTEQLARKVRAMLDA